MRELTNQTGGHLMDENVYSRFTNELLHITNALLYVLFSKTMLEVWVIISLYSDPLFCCFVLFTVVIEEGQKRASTIRQVIS